MTDLYEYSTPEIVRLTAVMAFDFASPHSVVRNCRSMFYSQIVIIS